MTVNGGQTVTNGSSHTIKGNGTIGIVGGGSLTNNGTIAPGLSPGQLNINGDLELGSTSNLSFEIGGTGQGTSYDWLDKIDNGTLTLNGTLTVRLINAFTPASTDTFTIVTTQQVLAGAFSNVANGARLNTADGGGSFQVTYNVLNDPTDSQNVTLSNFQPSATPTPTPGPPVTVTLSVAPGKISQGGTGVFTVSASPAPSQTISVNFAMSGNAIFGTDYTFSNPTTPVANEASSTVSSNQIQVLAGHTTGSITLYALVHSTRQKKVVATMTLEPGAFSSARPLDASPSITPASRSSPLSTSGSMRS